MVMSLVVGRNTIYWTIFISVQFSRKKNPFCLVRIQYKLENMHRCLKNVKGSNLEIAGVKEEPNAYKTVISIN